MSSSSIPEPIIQRIIDLSGDSRSCIEAAFREVSPTSIRINPNKPIGIDGAKISYAESGLCLPERPSFVADPAFHQGRYYVQEASSMILEAFVKQFFVDPGDKVVLDLCASPGGKSTHLRSLLHHDSLLISNEVDPTRRNVLEENMVKWGHMNQVLTQARSSSFASLDAFADMILLDAPCSGSGMMRKDSFAIKQWNEKLVTTCATLQEDLLSDAWKVLKPGGLLLYSTCSFSAEENEHVLERFLERNDADILTLDINGLETCSGSDLGVYMLPHQSNGEGLFMGAMRKRGSNEPGFLRGAGATRRELEFEFLEDDGLMVLEIESEKRVIGQQWRSMISDLKRAVKFIRPGLGVYLNRKGRSEMHPALALAASLKKTSFEMIELDKKEAISLLQGDVLRRDVRKGTALACYEGEGLMWLKGAGNRWNNQWPKQWRIRKQL